MEGWLNMWKKKYKNYKVNKKHEERIENQVGIRNEWLGWQNMKHMRDARLIMRWHAIDIDSRYKTDKDKDYAWCNTMRII